MATMGGTYREIKELRNQKMAENMALKLPSARLSQEIDQLKRMMDLTLQAFISAGGNSAT